jgi:hypothetical protein
MTGPSVDVRFALKSGRTLSTKGGAPPCAFRSLRRPCLLSVLTNSGDAHRRPGLTAERMGSFDAPPMHGNLFTDERGCGDLRELALEVSLPAVAGEINRPASVEHVEAVRHQSRL